MVKEKLVWCCVFLTWRLLSALTPWGENSEERERGREREEREKWNVRSGMTWSP